MQFLPNTGGVNTTRGMHHVDADSMYREKTRRGLYKNATSYIGQVLEATSHKTAAVRPLTSHL